MLTFLPIIYLEISVFVLKKVNFLVCLYKLTLYLCIKKTNYRPVNSLLNLSKICEKFIYQQLYDHFDSILLPKQCAFRKDHSVQHRLIFMVHKFKESRDRANKFGALFIDLSKAFDCIDYRLYRLLIDCIDYCVDYRLHTSQSINN